MRVFCSFLISILLVSCQATKTVQQTSTEANTSVSVNEQRAEEKFIEAVKMELLGNLQQAFNLYRESLNLDPGNDAAYFHLAKILFGQGRYEDALLNMEKAISLNDKNIYYLELYGNLLGGTGNYKEAIATYRKITEINPSDLNAYFNQAFFLEQNKQYDEALKVFESIEQQFGISEDIIRARQEIWLKQGKVENAAEEIRKLIQLNPGHIPYYTMLMDLYRNNKMEEKALEVLEEWRKNDPRNPQLDLLLADFYLKQGNTEQAFEKFLLAFRNPDLNIDLKIPVLLSLFPAMRGSEKAREQALLLAQALTDAHPDQAKSFAIYGDVLSQLNENEKALEKYLASLQLDKSKFPVWQQVMYLYSQAEQFDSLVAFSNKAIDYFPEQQMAYYFLGFGNMRLKSYQAAIESFGQAVKMGSEDVKMISQMYANMGDAYHSLKNFEASDSCYELALQIDPLNAYSLNNYSYYLSLRKEKLDQALKMSEQSNLLSTGNAAYLDTYGWILYQMYNYEEARTWLKKALDAGGYSDGTILEHYGDVLYKLKQPDEALEYWKKAKEKNVESEWIDRKIDDRKLYE